jgi:hypothetical protein
MEKSVHAQVFIPAAHRNRYDQLREDLGVEDHYFGDGIQGSGWKEGDTASIKLTLSIPTPLKVDDIESFAEQAVANMETLRGRIGEYI